MNARVTIAAIVVALTLFAASPSYAFPIGGFLKVVRVVPRHVAPPFVHR